MAIVATNTTEGNVIIKGDLTGTATSPQLIPTGIIDNLVATLILTAPTLVVDKKGRFVFAEDLTDLPWDITTLQNYYNTFISSSSILGQIKIGENINNAAGTISVNTGSEFTKGVLRVGDNINVINGVISVNDTTTSLKGITQIGENINSTDGLISLNIASYIDKGIARAGTYLQSSSGTFSIQNATTSQRGVVQLGNGFEMSGEILNASLASTTVAGLIQDSIDSLLLLTNGVLSRNPTYFATTTYKGYCRPGTGLEVIGNELTIATASKTKKGIVQVGNGFSILDGILSVDTLNVATTSSPGIVQIGSNISVTSGVISISDATTSSKGVVQAGSNFDVTSGTISIANATTSSKGVVQVGTGLSVSSGVISVPDATTSSKGIVQAGSNINVTSGTISVANATTLSKGAFRLNEDYFTSTAGNVSLNPNGNLISLNDRINFTHSYGYYRAPTFIGNIVSTINVYGFNNAFLAFTAPNPTVNFYFANNVSWTAIRKSTYVIKTSDTLTINPGPLVMLNDIVFPTVLNSGAILKFSVINIPGGPGGTLLVGVYNLRIN